MMIMSLVSMVLKIKDAWLNNIYADITIQSIVTITPIKPKKLLSILLLFTGCFDETLTVLFFSLFLKLIITI